MSYIRIPRRFRHQPPEDDDYVIVDAPRKRRRRQTTEPNLSEVIEYAKREIEALDRWQEEQKRKYTPTPAKTQQKIPYPVGLAIAFFLSPLIWISVGMLFYKLGQNIILGP